MKIAHVCLSLGKGGAEKLLVDSLPTYVKDGHDMTIVQLSSILEETGYIATVKEAGIKVITLSSGGFKNPVLLYKIIKLVKNGNYDVIHVHLFPCLYYFSIASRLIKMPVMVFTEHNTQNRRMVKKALQPIENFMYSRYDAIIAISHNVESMLKNWITKSLDKLVIINNGVNIEKFQSAQGYDDDEMQSQFKVDGKTIKLMMASRFSEPKDQPTIIKALQHLPEHFHVFFAGDGDDLSKSVQVAEELNLSHRVHFLGFRSDIPRLMKTAAVNILSSFYEGFSGVTLEGMASGKPFLGADVSGINDVVPNKNFLFEAGNEQELAKKIMQLVDDREYADSLVETAKQHVVKFDMRNMIEQHLDLYRTLLKNNK